MFEKLPDVLEKAVELKYGDQGKKEDSASEEKS